MTYAAYDVDPELGSPVSLVLFNRAGVIERVTDAATDLTKAGAVWRRVAGLEVPEAVVTSARVEQEEAVFRFPRTNAFAIAELSHDATESIVELSRTHLSDPDEEVSLRWRGYIEHAEVRRTEILVVCYQGRWQMDRQGEYGRAERNCRNHLYGTNCGLDKAAHEVMRTASATSGADVTIDLAVAPEAQHANGLMSWAGREFNIRAVSGTTLTLDRADPDFTAAVAASGAEPVTVAPGCAKNLVSCGFFQNTINFRGYPYIRDRETFGGRSAV